MAGIAKRSIKELNARTFVDNYFRLQLPVYVEGMAGEWRASRWTDAYLKSKVGKRHVKVFYNQNSIFDYNSQTAAGLVKRYSMAFADAFDMMSSDVGSHYYIRQQDVSREFPELESDIGKPALLDQWRILDATNIWIGGSGCTTPLHFDELDNFLVQIHGKKLVTLFPPSQSVNLYPASDDLLRHCSRVDAFAPDLSMHPLFSEAENHKIQLVLTPPDGLYIPRGWWHAVKSLERATSINFWWHSLI